MGLNPLLMVNVKVYHSQRVLVHFQLAHIKLFFYVLFLAEPSYIISFYSVVVIGGLQDAFKLILVLVRGSPGLAGICSHIVS